MSKVLSRGKKSLFERGAQSLKPIRVLFDEQIFFLQRFGGISRYFTELAKAFRENPSLGIEPVLPAKKTYNFHLLQEMGQEGFTAGYSRLTSILKLLMLLTRNPVKSSRADLVHLTFYLPGFLSRFKTLPKVVTLFDMIPETVSGQRRLWNPHFSKRRYIQRANAVVSISDSSTKEMLGEYGLSKTVITTHLGVSEEFGPNLPRCQGAPPYYFLFVGARGGYKSAHLAITALASLPKSQNTPQLVFAGGGPLSKKELTFISKLGVRGQVLQMSVSDAELPLLYSNSIALLYPSTHEGFGLPLVEAMASGVPIIAADIPINLEIAGDVANYFRVGDAGAMAQQMLSVTLNQELQGPKIAEGLNRSKSFTWLECARKTAEVYKALMRENVKN